MTARLKAIFQITKLQNTTSENHKHAELINNQNALVLTACVKEYISQQSYNSK